MMSATQPTHRTETTPPCVPYESLRQRHLADLQRWLPTHLERLDWSAERLRAERVARLRRQVAWAQARSPWHRGRLAGIDAASLDESDLPCLPVMTKDDVMTHFDAIVTDSRLSLEHVEAHLAGLRGDAYQLDRYHAIASGGSCGRRGVFVWDWEAWGDFYLGLFRELLRERLRAGLAAQPMVGATVAAHHSSHASSALAQTFSNPAVVVHALPVTLPFAELIAGLNRLQPQLLMGYPSVFYELAFAARDGRLTIAPRWIVSGAEPLLPEIRALLEATWPVPVINAYASSEAGAMAIGCGAGPWMHVCDDLLIVEPVDARGRAVAAGERSAKLYLTNLVNPLLPLLRYELTDEITLLPGPCPCGSAHRRVADVQGRLDECLVYPGAATVHPHVFRSRLGREANVVEYQVRQTPAGAAIALRLRGPVDLAALERDLAVELGHLGLPRPEVSVTPVETLERHAVSGKLKRFVPLPRG